MLETNKSFWLFLTGLTIEREGCLLSMLNIGSGITEAIASFAGVPRGEQLTQMQQIKQLCIEIRDDPQVDDKYISGNRDITMYSGMMVLQHTTPPYM